jgi:hypothetical protein
MMPLTGRAEGAGRQTWLLVNLTDALGWRGNSTAAQWLGLAFTI